MCDEGKIRVKTIACEQDAMNEICKYTLNAIVFEVFVYAKCSYYLFENEQTMTRKTAKVRGQNRDKQRAIRK